MNIDGPIYKILFLIWLGLIVFLSLVPQSDNYQALSSKLSLTSSGFFQHSAGYLILGVLACKAFEKRLIYQHLTLIFVLGILIEVAQCVVPTRSFNIFDILANGLGVLVAYFIFSVLKHYKREYI